MNSTSFLLYAGAYDGKRDPNIRLLQFDAASGELQPLDLDIEAPNSLFVTTHPNGRFLYATGNRPEPCVKAFRIAPDTGALTFLNSSPSHGKIPCYLSVDRSGRFILVANYTGGTVAVLPIEDNGNLGEATEVIQHAGKSQNPDRQEGPHPHSIILSPDNRFALAADLGADRIVVYRFDDTTGRLSLNDPPWAEANPGAGPRHMVFHPTGAFLYVINELDNTMTTFAWETSHGVLQKLQTVSTLPDGFSGETYCADVRIAASGKFLYASNRGHDSIAVFAIDRISGALSTVAIEPTCGKCPRSIIIDPTGVWLLVANEKSDAIAVFHIDPSTGRLSPAGEAATLPAPTCLQFLAVAG